MAEVSLVTKEMRDAVGVEREPFVIQIDRWLVRLFAEAVGDHNPLYLDEEFAKQTRFAGTIVPPGLFSALLMLGKHNELPFSMPVKRVLDGGTGFEFLKPARVGDVLTVRSKLVDIRERETRLGKTLFLSLETSWTNQTNEVVAISRSLRISY
ncbi:MAG: MaoC family dehydratase N-terminal domain-containing protein [Chloroflexi bacterium]|nr:MaoC family dehydratase N-terminal domain-containing protein [Chloroflexota bacterium]